MSSLWRHPRSRYWTACFTDASGHQRKRSTKETDKRKAKIIAEAWEQAESLGSRGLLTSREQLRIVLEQTLQRLTGKTPESFTVTSWLRRWLEGERRAVADSTLETYTVHVEDFLDFLGTRAFCSLEAVTTDDLTAYRNHLLAEGRSPRTTNGTVRKTLKRAFQAAVNEGQLQRSPVAALRYLRDVTVEKGVFTAGQVRQLVDAAEGEWKGLVLAGYYTGARLGDLVGLTWGNVDLVERSITFVQKKTGARLKVPIHPEFEDYLLTLRVPDDGRKPLFPKLSKLRRTGKTGLCAKFRGLMDEAGIDAGIARPKSGKAGRTVSKLSFHSLRHSFVSALANQGVPADVRQKLCGHADPGVHALYTHHEFELVRAALETIAPLPKEAH